MKRIDLDPDWAPWDKCCHEIIGWFETSEDSWEIHCNFPIGHEGPHREPTEDEI